MQEMELVGVSGFEPETTCSQSMRSTRLSYTPVKKACRPAKLKLQPSTSDSPGRFEQTLTGLFAGRLVWSG